MLAAYGLHVEAVLVEIVPNIIQNVTRFLDSIVEEIW